MSSSELAPVSTLIEERQAASPPAALAVAPPPRPGRWLTAAVVLLAAVGLVWGGWLLTGGRLYWVASPSMGEAAPEGSLVATAPLPPVANLHVGQLVVFHTPGATSTYVHRVVAVLPGDRYRTRGDLERVADPWVLTRADLDGTVVAVIPAVGWLYHSATWFLLGGACLVVLGMSLGPTGRRWVRYFGPALLLAVPIFRYRPLVAGYVLGTAQHRGTAEVHLVGSGILPAHYSIPGGAPVYAAPGQAVTLSGPLPPGSRGVADLPVHMAAAFPWWGWLVLVVVVASPLLFLELEVHRARRGEPPEGRAVEGEAGSASVGVLALDRPE